MKTSTDTFESLILAFQHKYSLSAIFDDFLTMACCSLGINPATRLSYDEDLYMETISKYKNDVLRFNFPKMLTALMNEIDIGLNAVQYNDVLGNFYEKHIFTKDSSVILTPWPVCMSMAKMSVSPFNTNNSEPLRVLDPCCGSGRMLLAMAKEIGTNHYFYGIDINPQCAKMTALNCFLNGLFKAEVVCGNSLTLDGFMFSYYTSFLPFGLFKITDSSSSKLWQHYVSAFKDGLDKNIMLF